MNAPRVHLPKINAPRRATTQEGHDTQFDLDKMLGAAVLEQARYFRELRGALQREALRAFAAERKSVSEPVGEHALMMAHVRRVAVLLAATRLLGRVRVLKELGRPLSLGRTVTVHFDEVLGQVGVNEAIAYLQSLPVATREQWQQLMQESARAAFTAAGIENTAALEALRDLVTQALRENWTRPEFEQAAEELLDKFESRAGSLRTLWNTATSTAMAKGRQDIFLDPEIAKIVPYWLYDAILDDRVRPNHAALNGAIAPIKWERWWGMRGLRCPNGYNCRCTMIGLTAARAQKLIADGGVFFDATRGVSYGGPDIGFIKFAEAGKSVSCEPDAGWEKAA